jgi:hypothetical protein
LPDTPHDHGLVFGGANWELIQQLGTETFARILIAGLPYLAARAELPTEYREALRMGDQIRYGGVHAGTIDQVFDARGFDVLDVYADVGFLDVGEPISGSLADGQVAFYFFDEFPGSRRLVFRLTGTGDADLIVATANGPFDIQDPDTYEFSENASSSETVTISGGTLPSIDDDGWVVFVPDFQDGQPSTYTLTVTETLPQPTLAVSTPEEGEIAEIGELDFFVFQAEGGDVLRLEVTALDPLLDPLAVVFDPHGDLLASDDDAGPDLDPLVQGFRVPADGRYAVAVLSPAADVDPRVGTGRYEVRLLPCTATVPDTDGDGLADPCDDDDDGDGFIDDEDRDAPLDPLACVDVDEDGCDDCSSGQWTFLDDGPDFEQDGLCDPGDPDDDNDGCPDESDPSPLLPSVDGDLDFLGDDCDNCPDVPNADQVDLDGDEIGDACDDFVPEPAAGAAGVAAFLSLAMLTRRRAGRSIR